MSDKNHVFQLTGVWNGTKLGDGILHTTDGRTLEYGLPTDFGGREGRTNPEELLLESVCSCYSLTLAILAERRRLPLTRIALAATAEVVEQPGGTLKYQSICLVPTLTMAGADDKQREQAHDSAHKAEQYCVISNALRGNVEITVEPHIEQE